VRDELRGELPKDYDIATSARPEEVEALFDKTAPVGAQFGVILVIVEDIPFEVATFRQDETYLDGRHQGVTGLSRKEGKIGGFMELDNSENPCCGDCDGGEDDDEY
jgi:poly(A) polymerase